MRQFYAGRTIARSNFFAVFHGVTSERRPRDKIFWLHSKCR